MKKELKNQFLFFIYLSKERFGLKQPSPLKAAQVKSTKDSTAIRYKSALTKTIANLLPYMAMF